MGAPSRSVVQVLVLLGVGSIEAGLLGAGTGGGSCAAAPFRTPVSQLQWPGGCPASAPCCSEFGYCHSRENWAAGGFRDCNGQSNGRPLEAGAIAAEQAAAAGGDTRGLALLGNSVGAGAGGVGYGAGAPGFGAGGAGAAGFGAGGAGLGGAGASGFGAGGAGFGAGGAGGAGAAGFGAGGAGAAGFGAGGAGFGAGGAGAAGFGAGGAGAGAGGAGYGAGGVGGAGFGAGGAGYGAGGAGNGGAGGSSGIPIYSAQGAGSPAIGYFYG